MSDLNGEIIIPNGYAIGCEISLSYKPIHQLSEKINIARGICKVPLFVPHALAH